MVKERVTFSIVGSGVEPASVSVRELLECLEHFQTAILETAKKLNIPDVDDAFLALVQVRKGSVLPSCVFEQRLVPAVQTCARAVRRAQYHNLPRRAHEALSQLSEKAIKKGRRIGFRGNRKLKIGACEISADRPVPVRHTSLAKEWTTVYGELVGVGGAKAPKATIRPITQADLVYAELSRENAIELGKRGIYTEIGVEGWAQVDVSEGRIHELKIERVLPYRATSPEDAFMSLRAAANGRWDGIDVERFLSEQRDELP